MQFDKTMSIHNRFEIKVTDSKTGQVKQTAVAENIILNRMYTRLLDFNNYATNIFFGRGTGVPTPDRTTLFSQIGYKPSTQVEVVVARPTSRAQRTIRLGVGEYVGETITEVGISDSTTQINTHAMIKDAEGNQISVTKGELDVIDIYSTIYVVVEDFDDKAIIGNSLVRSILYNLSMSSSNTHMYLGVAGKGAVVRSFSTSSSRTTDLDEKKTTISRRVGIDQANGPIKYIIWGGVVAFDVTYNNTWKDFNYECVIGTGDGASLEYDFPVDDVQSLSVTIDGVTLEPTEYTIINTYESGFDYYDSSRLGSNGNIADTQIYANYALNSICPYHYFYKEDGFNGFKWSGNMSGSDPVVSYPDNAYITIWTSLDGENWTQRYNTITKSSGVRSYTINVNDPYVRIYQRPTAGTIMTVQGWEFAKAGVRKIAFNTPPPHDSIIKAQITTNDIPKDEEHVLDITATIQFGEVAE